MTGMLVALTVRAQTTETTLEPKTPAWSMTPLRLTVSW